MKKLTLIITLVLAATLALCSCAGNASAKSLDTVYNEIKAQVKLSQMSELDSADKLDRYYGIAEEDVEEFAGGVNSSGVEQEEIVLIKATDDNAAKRIKEALDNRYEAKLAENVNYNPEQAEIIKRCKVEQDGLYVSMIVSENVEKITEIYKAR